ncbi:MAG: TatD family hydrolase [Bacilli bacterium]|nr:TatD family hydrolase [Bacilli bacterium]
MLIDSHCHINDPKFLGREEDYVLDAIKANVGLMLVVGYDLKSSIDAVNIANRFHNVYAAVGIIPAEVKNAKSGDLKEIEKLLINKKVIAIGEIGLDYYWDKDEETKKTQKEYFVKQIELANKYNLPVSIHCRDAYENLINTLKEFPVNRRGIIHCFSSSVEISRILTEMGYLLGIGGTVTFKNNVKGKAVVIDVDRSKYVLETDAPYLTPVPYRGQENQSKYLGFIRDEIASLKQISFIDVEEETTLNFKRLFNL